MDYKIDNKLIGFCENKKINSIPLYLIKDINSLKLTSLISEKQKIFLKSTFNLELENFGFFPDEDNHLGGAVAILTETIEPRKSIIDQAAKLSEKLPKKKWALECLDELNNQETYNFILGWGLSFYKFNIKPNNKRSNINQTLCIKNIKDLIKENEFQKCCAELKGIFLARDLINLPPNILTPYNYEKIVKNCFKDFSTKIDTYKDKKLEKNFPLINFVGRSSENKPLLLDIKWSKSKKNIFPNITLIGKGVTFDSGGLDVKPSSGMMLMKKDMGGSAVVLGIAYALISMNCPVNLRVILPMAENSISDKSMRPLDVIYARNNTPVEIGNTDAEGRLLLADALTFSQENNVKSDFVIDFATLTGAARVALGTELPALFTNDNDLGERIINEGKEQIDPMWELPLFSPYERYLENKYDALSSTGSAGTGGAITAALFLKKFVDTDTKWAHVDLMAWNTSGRPGFPVGGEAMGLRNIVNMIIKYCNQK
ncbi:leucyl aminopeptidase family protein [Candidatus Levibacter sp. Uisw_134_01]|uniref:M17 family metallopeptidase n=1 Tax=Candidatus Levibacter sp. Uisw_134_01 TaxID=3230999 RepID=UPI003D4BC3A0